MPSDAPLSRTIAILMPGDMGHAVGRVLRDHGQDVVTCLQGRSAHSRALAAEGGLRDIPELTDLVRQCDMILSILPPAAALAQAETVAAAMRTAGATPVYVDCNAISPATATAVSEIVAAAGAPFIDAGIIGAAPGKGSATRFYASGADLAPLAALDGQGIKVLSLGAEVGKASAMKMVYAALTKGTWTLHAALLLAASRTGVLPDLLSELEHSQGAALNAMRARIPRLPADSARWVGEMQEIARTFTDVGVPDGFHEGAAEIFRILARTPFAAETRQSIDSSRTLEEILSVCAAQLAEAD